MAFSAAIRALRRGAGFSGDSRPSRAAGARRGSGRRGPSLAARPGGLFVLLSSLSGFTRTACCSSWMPTPARPMSVGPDFRLFASRSSLQRRLAVDGVARATLGGSVILLGGRLCGATGIECLIPYPRTLRGFYCQSVCCLFRVHRSLRSLLRPRASALLRCGEPAPISSLCVLQAC